jgi:hypothetical protein
MRLVIRASLRLPANRIALDSQTSVPSDAADLPAGLSLRTLRPVARRLHEGASEAELGLDRFRSVVERRVGMREVPLWWSYRVRVAVK